MQVTQIMSDNMDRIYYYNSPLDVYSFFNSRDMVKGFIEHFFALSESFSGLIDNKGNQVPYPVQWYDSAGQWQVDYNYLMFVIGTWIGKWTKEEAHVLSFVRGYGVYRNSIPNTIMNNNRRGLMVFLCETLNLFTTRNKKYDMGIDKYLQYNESVIEENDKYYSIKVVGLSRKRVRFFLSEDHEKSSRYTTNEWENKECFNSDECVQVAFRSQESTKFWKSHSDEKRRRMFSIEISDFLNTAQDLLQLNSVD